MELSVFFKSVIDQDRAPIVLCNYNKQSSFSCACGFGAVLFLLQPLLWQQGRSYYQCTAISFADFVEPIPEIDTATLSRAVVASISKLGLPEFMKRLNVMTEATKTDIYTIARRETTRSTKVICPCCGKEFYRRFAHQRFCSGRCREENARRARTQFSAYEYDKKNAGGRNIAISGNIV